MTLSITTPPRRFLPADFDPARLDALTVLFDELRDRPVGTTAELERWLHDESELLAAIDAELARRYIAMTRHTDSEATRERYLELEREVSPQVKVRKDELDRRLLALSDTVPLDQQRYGVLLRGRRTAQAIFRAENTALETTEAELQTHQQALMGKLTVEFRGRAHTLQQMAQYLEDRAPATRRDAYLATLEARRSTWPELERILDDLIALRTQMARNADFSTYVPFRFRQLQRFDYDVDACARFHRAIERAVVPAVLRLNERRRAALGVDTLRPYDLDVDPVAKAPLRPFTTEAELVRLVGDIVGTVDPRFTDELAVLRDRELLDLMSREGKAPGGYQYTLEDERLPFIFMNAVGAHRDVQTLLHEAGHAFHTILSRDEPLLDYRDAPIEFAETASMSMELMGLERIAVAYGSEDARSARRMHFEKVLRLLPWIAMIDAFQLWLYEHPDHDRGARRACWLELSERFSPGVDYEGIEDARAWQWTGQPHLYGSPLYYIEYGIAQIAALQLWRHYRRDPAAAVRRYRESLALGGSRPLPELFAAAGVRFDVSEAMLAALVADVEATLQS